MSYTQHYLMAREDFRRQRTLAAYQFIASRLTGKNPGLLSFEEISRNLHVSGGYDRGIVEIPVSAIIGSVSRHSEFTRTFLPLTSHNIERWSRVKIAIEIGTNGGLPPIEVYQIGEAYFVIDGHNRVSVTREIGAKFIQARVTEVRTRVPLEPGMKPEDFILAAEQAEFLEETHFDTILSEANIRLTIPGYYRLLREHIEVHRYYMGMERKADIYLDEAVKHWFNEVYLPVQKAIHETGILQEFPGKTDADLYIWVSVHRYLLEKDLGWVISPETAARNLAMRASPRTWRVIQRWGRGLLRSLVPAALQKAPSPGVWRQGLQEEGDCLFNNMLVPVRDLESSRAAVEQAVEFARCAGGTIQGLHVVSDPVSVQSEAAKTLRTGFIQILETRGKNGSLAVVTGEVTDSIIENSRLAELLVINVQHPTGPSLTERFGSGLHTIILHSQRPILAVTSKVSPLKRLLLAYDGSPRAREALIVAAFFAGKWKVPLYVLSANPNRLKANRLLDEACLYLNARDVDAHYLARQGDAGAEIIQAVEATGSDLILMGGYGNSSLVGLVLGSTVDYILQRTEVPVMICK